MKLKTRLIIAFITVSVLPIILAGLLIFGMSEYQINAMEKNYGISGTAYKDFRNSVQMLNRLTEKSYRSLREIAEENPGRLEDVAYLEEINETLEETKSYLLVRKNNKLVFIGGDTEKARALMYQLPEYDEHDYTSENGVYYGGDVQALVKQIDFEYFDKSLGSAFIVTDVSDMIPEMRQLIGDILVAVIVILVLTAALLIFWIYKGVTYPLSKMQKAAQSIRDGNLDFRYQQRRTTNSDSSAGTLKTCVSV